MRRLLLILILSFLALPRPAPAQDLPEASPDALAAHVEGLRAYLANDYVGAIPHLLRAHELDPTFYVPLFIAALNAGNAGMTPLADSLWGVVAEHRSHFSDYYQRLIDIYVMRRNGGDWAESMELARAVARDYPGTKANYNLALWSNNDGKPREALTALARLDPDREPMKGWLSYFEVKCGALHWVGDPEEELRCGQETVQRFPGRRAAHYLVADALAGMGRTAEAEAALKEALGHPDVLLGYSEGGLMGMLGLELLAHGGDPAVASRLQSDAVAWYAALPSDRARIPALRRQQAYWLYATGDYRAAYQKLQSIVADLGSIWDHGYFGITAALAGDKAAAEKARADFMAGAYSPMPSVQHYWAGLISAALDDTEGAAAHFAQSWGNVNSHLEPVLRLKMGNHPAYRKFAQPRG